MVQASLSTRSVPTIGGGALDGGAFLTAFKDTVLQLGTHQHFADDVRPTARYGCDVKQTGSDVAATCARRRAVLCADPDGSGTRY